ncbi:uncharacterized protein JN550_002885 [Neoarthrinium moseri]|uniref:uncharacterized protein n=1 Tax=Neoarthrinium moseri TaxID=1658444 RepID=UPI001FDE1E3D|nr:uncharacterized protein JN550_002885 [Neoarthrinium moseri]KAI1874306.1 hypothetical protein JN550_002885 [Neoarthrinium moseri]
MAQTELVVFEFDGTLFDTHQSISHCIKLTFDAFLPEQALPESAVHHLISSGKGLEESFRELHPDPTSLDESAWVLKYRSLYAEHGQPLITSFAGASDLLEKLHKRGTPVAIVSNKGVAAVVTALDRNGLGGVIPDDLIVGDKTPGATKKPDPSSYTKVLTPALKRYGIDSVDAKNVLVVGDTVADIQFAANIGAKSVWCRYGYGDKSACEKLRPDFSVDSLKDVIAILKE